MIELIRNLSPFPTINSDQVLSNGNNLDQPNHCQKCLHKRCHSFLRNEPLSIVNHYVCDDGFSLFLLKFKSGSLLINGVLDLMLNIECPRHIKRTYRSQKISKEQIEEWCQWINQIEENLPKEIEFQVQEKVAGLHDVKTATNLILRNAEAIISQLPGESTDQRIENADPKIKALYKSVELLKSRLDALSIIANPKSASYGVKRKTSTHRIFTKFSRMFEEIASQKKVYIKVEGSSYNAPKVYDSFELIPLILIDNAIKYSNKNQTVKVMINDVKGGVSVEVHSYGPIVSLGDQSKIFEKGFRTEHAKQMASDGSGLGLYIAQIVAEANGINSIKYRGECQCEIEGVPTGNNYFELFYK